MAFDANTLETMLEQIDLAELDPLEQLFVSDFMGKGVGKAKALRVVINTVEGDFSQLSPMLAEMAEQLERLEQGLVTAQQLIDQGWTLENRHPYPIWVIQSPDQKQHVQISHYDDLNEVTFRLEGTTYKKI